LLWWARLARGDESYSACKNRAHIAAAHLEEAILQHDIVLVAGHGFFNHMLGSVLKRQGWKERPDLVETSVRSGYWSCKILEKTPEPDVT
jgi:broad specificity phosphatase PhoE